jgi:hypothetical protein
LKYKKRKPAPEVTRAERETMNSTYYIGATEYLIRETNTGHKVLEVLNHDRECEEVYQGTLDECIEWLDNKAEKAINDEY